MKKTPLKKRLQYWFDNRMAEGSMGLIRLLAAFTVLAVLLIAFTVFRLGLYEEGGFLGALWESLSTIINGWMPSFEDGGIGYLILMSVAAVIGLLITSVLIGIVSSAIEEKITSLKKGTSEIIEEGHTVVLGFYPGEYSLIEQLVLAANTSQRCIVVAGDADQEEMRQQICDNVAIPKNVRLICRNIDIFDPAALEKCAVGSCRSVIISPSDDFTTAKALLAVSALIDAESSRVSVCAIVSGSDYLFPASIAAQHNITIIRSHEMLAKIIAHSCTQPGLSETFREIFNFKGSEFYSPDVRKTAGLSFREALLRVDGGVPAGICKDGRILLNPPAQTLIEQGDKLLTMAENESSVVLSDAPCTDIFHPGRSRNAGSGRTKVTLIGYNGSIGTVLQELPEDVSEVRLCIPGDENYESASATAAARGLKEERLAGDPSDPEVLEKLAGFSEHIIILSDHDLDEDEADMQTIFQILRLRDIRTRLGLSFNITAEMRRENNQKLVIMNDNTDFVVASNMSSLFLAQLSENPALIDVFREILSGEGNELYLLPAAGLSCDGPLTAAEIRRRAFDQGYIFLGYLPGAGKESVYTPGLSETIDLCPGDQLILLGESK